MPAPEPEPGPACAPKQEALPWGRNDLPFAQRFETSVTVHWPVPVRPSTVRAELIGHYQPCMTDIYLHIDARMADYIRTHP